ETLRRSCSRKFRSTRNKCSPGAKCHRDLCRRGWWSPREPDKDDSRETSQLRRILRKSRGSWSEAWGIPRCANLQRYCLLRFVARECFRLCPRCRGASRRVYSVVPTRRKRRPSFESSGLRASVWSRIFQWCGRALRSNTKEIGGTQRVSDHVQGRH